MYADDRAQVSLLGRLKSSVLTLLRGRLESSLASQIARVLKILYKQTAFLVPHCKQERKDLTALIGLLREHDTPEAFDLRRHRFNPSSLVSVQ